MPRFFVSVFAVFILLSAPVLRAAWVDFAVVELPGFIEREGLEGALAGVDLREATEGDRFAGGGALLRGVPVLFAQRFRISGKGEFASSTRIGVGRAEVSGSLTASRIAVRIALSEGMKAPLRRFSQSSLAGEAPLAEGVARVLSLKKSEVRRPSVKKGTTKIETIQTTSAVLYQYLNQ